MAVQINPMLQQSLIQTGKCRILKCVFYSIHNDTEEYTENYTAAWWWNTCSMITMSHDSGPDNFRWPCNDILFIYRVFDNDCSPSTVETSKTLAKLLLYYNSLNKVTLLCKVSDWCVLFNFKNQELQISNQRGHQQQQQQHPACAGMTVG